MDIVLFKAFAIVVILAIGMSAGLLPVRMGPSEGRRRFFSYANALGGGIFLAAGFAHMIPDGIESLEFLELDFPLAAFMAVVGFLLVLFIERVAMANTDEGAVMTDAAKGSTYPYILLAVLAVHSLIAGATLGLEQEVTATLGILLAVVAHKGSAAFALGVSMRQPSIAQSQATRMILFFSATTPIGILIGTIASAYLVGNTAHLIEGLFDGLAGGTFLYVAILDIIQEEFEQPANRYAKFGLLGAGASGMSALAIWA